MAFNDFMAKVRYWDNRAAKWMMRHFYIIFFEFLLVLIFFGCFVNALKIIDVRRDFAVQSNLVERLLLIQTQTTVLILILILLNSFWMLYIFNNIIRFRSLLKEINFNLSKRKNH